MAARITTRFWVILTIAILLIWQPGNFIFASADRQTKQIEPAKPAAPAAASSAAPSISAGALHACVLQADGSLICWGQNDEGQLNIPAPNNGFTQVSAGGYHTCALKTDGSLACWGLDDLGQATPPDENSRYKQVSAGVQHTCALKVDGSIQCWGDQSEGQSTPPTQNSGFIQIASGGYHTCALKVDGSIACWGRNVDGQSLSPAGSSFIQVSAGGYHNCALIADGSLTCWGRIYEGQTNPPVENSGFREISLGDAHTCGLKADGSLECWGHNQDGQINIPGGSNNIAQVSAGGHNTCALKVDGTLACWGLNSDGQSSPPVLTGGTGANIEISTGVYHTCSLKADGSISCWGNPDDGRTNVPAPNNSFTQVAAFESHTCGLMANGTVACWGSNGRGQTTLPALNSGFIQVDGGQLHTCALKADGSVLCWGSNIYGELNLPADNSNFKQISAGGHSTCGLKADGSLACWGWLPDPQGDIPDPNSGFTQVSVNMYNTCGLKADGSLRCWGFSGYSQNNIPAPNNGFSLVSVGFNHTCAMRTAGSIACWGAGSAGKSSSIPSPNNEFIRMDAGGGHSCAIKADGSMTCWGDNTSGRAPVIALIPDPLPDSLYNAPYTQALTASGGTLPASSYRFKLFSGTLPPGISLSDAGLFSGTPVLSGNSSLSITTIDDNQYFSTRSLTLSVAKATPTAILSLTGLPTTYDETPHPANVIVASSSVPGSVSDIRYNGSTTIPTNAGTYAVTASFIPSDTLNYNPLTSLSAGNFVINKATPTVGVWVTNTPVTYNGQAHSASVNASASVPGSFSDLLTGGALDQTDAGSYLVTIKFTPTDTANYNTLTGSSAEPFVINKATPLILLAITNSPVTYNGLAQSADVSLLGSSVPGALSGVLVGGAASQIDAGSYPVTASFVPQDPDNYNTLTGLSAGSFVISRAAASASVVLTNSPVTYTGEPHPAELEIVHSSVPGFLSSIQYNGSTIVPTNAGEYLVTADFIPADTQNFHSIEEMPAGSLVIEKATPSATVTLASPDIIFDGLPHMVTVHLQASSVPGTVSSIRIGVASSRTNAGTYPVTAGFVPDDSANYNTLTGLPAGSFTIHKAEPSATLSIMNPSVPYNGDPQAALVEITSSSIPGVLSNVRHAGSSSSPVDAGIYPVTADFIPTDTTNYTSLTGLSAGVFTIQKAAPAASFVLQSPPVRYDGTPHSAEVEFLSSSVPGTIGQILTGGALHQTDVGIYPVTVEFIPLDEANYTRLNGVPAGDLVIEKAVLTVTARDLVKPVGGSFPVPVLEYICQGFVNDETESVLAGAPLLSVTALAESSSGFYPITITQGTLAAKNYSFVFIDGLLEIEKSIRYLPFLIVIQR